MKRVPRLTDYLLAILLVASIVALVLVFFVYLPSIADLLRDSDVLQTAKKMALKGCLATVISTGVMTASFVLLKLRFRG